MYTCIQFAAKMIPQASGVNGSDGMEIRQLLHADCLWNQVTAGHQFYTPSRDGYRYNYIACTLILKLY
jgi:hypothetical protein